MPREEASADYPDLVAACDRVLQAWERLIEQLPDEHISTPNPNPKSSHRTMRRMVVNVFRWMEEETAAFDTGRFSYQALHDAQAVTDFKTSREMLDYARNIRARWGARAIKVTPEQAQGPLVTNDHGTMTQYEMLDAAARHAAGHLRQSYDFFRRIGITPKREMTDAEMAPIAILSRLY